MGIWFRFFFTVGARGRRHAIGPFDNAPKASGHTEQRQAEHKDGGGVKDFVQVQPHNQTKDHRGDHADCQIQTVL